MRKNVRASPYFRNEDFMEVNPILILGDIIVFNICDAPPCDRV